MVPKARQGHSAESLKLLGLLRDWVPWCSGKLLENKMSPLAWVVTPKATSLHEGTRSAVFLSGPRLQVLLSTHALLVSSTWWRRAHRQGRVPAAGADVQLCARTDGGQTVPLWKIHKHSRMALSSPDTCSGRARQMSFL